MEKKQREFPSGWETFEIMDCVKNKNFSVKHIKKSNYKKDGVFPVVDQGEEFVAGYWDDPEFLYQGDLPVIIFGDHTRRFKIIDFPFICGGQGVKILQPDKSKVDPYFFYFSLLKQGVPTRGYNRHFKLLKEIEIPVPTLKEQKKISWVLNSIQEGLEKTENIILASKELKKSLMKHLFTYGPTPIRETENIKVRITSIGKVPEDWEIKKLGEICQTSTGGTPSRKKPEFYNGEIPWIKSGELEDNFIDSSIETISKEGLKNSSAKIFPKGSLLIALYGATVGKTSILNIDASTNQAVCAIIANGTINNHFLRHFLIFRRRELLSQRYGGAQPNVSQTIIRNLEVPIPPIKIQNKISFFLNTIDQKIQAEENKKKALEDLFNTLLNDLMTGKIRVNDLEV